MKFFLRLDWCQHLIVYAKCVAHRSGDDAVLELAANFGSRQLHLIIFF